jgi:hypothetical protein
MKQVFFDSVLLKFDKRLNCKKIKLLFVLDLCSQTLIQSLQYQVLEKILIEEIKRYSVCDLP